MAGGAALALLVAGCGGSDDDETGSDPSTASGTAAASADVPPNELLDPCTVMTDSELREFGQDPATRRPATSSSAMLTGCKWFGKLVGLQVGTVPESLDEFRQRGHQVEGQFPTFEDVQIEGRPAVQYSVDPSTSTACAVSMTAGSGVVDVLVGDASGLDAPQDLCPVAREAMKVIAAKLPAQGE